MLTAQDDLIGHQLPTTYDHVGTSDPSWMERLWYTGHPKSGELIFDIGLGYHPNRNVMDAFAGVTVGSIQTNVRASRRLRPNPLDTEVGPIKIEVLEGLKRHRLSSTWHVASSSALTAAGSRWKVSDTKLHRASGWGSATIPGASAEKCGPTRAIRR